MPSQSATDESPAPESTPLPSLASRLALLALHMILLAEFLAALVMMCPSLVFGRARHVGGYTVYSDGTWPAGLSRALSEADRRLISQGLTPPHGQDIYFCATGWRLFLLAGPGADGFDGAFNPWTWRIALATQHMIGGSPPEEHEFTETLTHELAHAAITYALGWRNGELNHWKGEGLASRVGYASDTRIRPTGGHYRRIESEAAEYYLARILVTEVSGPGPLTDTTLLRIVHDPRTAAAVQRSAFRPMPSAPLAEDSMLLTSLRLGLGPPVWFCHFVLGSLRHEG
jgi:hypothetical protein